MKPRPRPRPISSEHPRIFLAEWMRKKSLSDSDVAEQMGSARETITRYRNEPHRMNSEVIIHISGVLGIKPGDLWRSPERADFNAIFEHLSDEESQRAAQAMRELTRRRD